MTLSTVLDHKAILYMFTFICIHIRSSQRVPTNSMLFRKNLVTANAVGQGPAAEALLRCKAAPTDPVAIDNAEVRRPSNGSAISSSSVDAPGNVLAGGATFESHIPHMLCKLPSLVPRCSSPPILLPFSAFFSIRVFFGEAPRFSACITHVLRPTSHDARTLTCALFSLILSFSHNSHTHSIHTHAHTPLSDAPPWTSSHHHKHKPKARVSRFHMPAHASFKKRHRMMRQQNLRDP